MNIQQSINLKIFEEFEKQQIVFAFPTQTLYLEKKFQEDKNKAAIIKSEGQ
jgi:small-conductance mechanosensitive channel